MAAKAIACVYRHSVPSPRSWRETERSQERNPLVGRFLNRYWDEDCFYDWGDDPGFLPPRRFLVVRQEPAGASAEETFEGG